MMTRWEMPVIKDQEVRVLREKPENVEQTLGYVAHDIRYAKRVYGLCVLARWIL